MKRGLWIVAGLCLAAGIIVGCSYLGTVVQNVAPVAQIDATPTSGDSPLAVALSAEDSIDADGTIVSWDWDFGDTQTDSGELVVHAFTTQTGSSVYTVVLIVEDDDGATDTAAVNVTVRP